MAMKERWKQVIQSVTGAKEETHTDIYTIFSEAHIHVKQGALLATKIALQNAVSLEHLTFVGMGGSMHPGFILQTYLQNIGYKKPVNIIRDDTIPANISKKGFLFVISYSGNTEETLEAYRQAYREGYRMIVITSGGKMKDIATKHGTVCVDLPKGYEPRHCFYFIFGVLLQIMQNSGIIEDLDKEMEHIDAIFRKDMFTTIGKQIAAKIDGKMTLIYTTEKFARVGERWKICLNENAKIHAFHNIMPELDHNEINAFETKRDDMHVIVLADEEETEHHRKCIQMTKQIIQEQGYHVTELVVKGPTYVSRILSAIYIGDWVSYYSAVQRNVDLREIKLIVRLKELLKE